MKVKIWRPDPDTFGGGPLRIALTAETDSERLELGSVYLEGHHSSVLFHLESWSPVDALGGTDEVAFETASEPDPRE